MKKGSGDDPFASEDTEAPSSKIETHEESDGGTVETVSKPSSTDEERPSTIPQPSDELPYLASRQLKNKSVKSDRDQIPFFLRTTVQEGERELRRAVEDALNQEMNKTDLREAAYVFAQRHPEGVADVLREWGIEYLE